MLSVFSRPAVTLLNFDSDFFIGYFALTFPEKKKENSFEVCVKMRDTTLKILEMITICQQT